MRSRPSASVQRQLIGTLVLTQVQVGFWRQSFGIGFQPRFGSAPMSGVTPLWRWPPASTW